MTARPGFCHAAQKKNAQFSVYEALIKGKIPRSYLLTPAKTTRGVCAGQALTYSLISFQYLNNFSELLFVVISSTVTVAVKVSSFQFQLSYIQSKDKMFCSIV